MAGAAVKSPTAPKPLADMKERLDALAAERKRLFPTWKHELEAAKGNVTLAGMKHTPTLTRNQASRLTYRLGLEKYASELRVKAVGKAKGTPKRK